MERVKITSIREGQQFAVSLFTPAGKKLLSAETAVSASQLAILRGLADPWLFAAESLDVLIEAGEVEPPPDWRRSRESKQAERSESERTTSEATRRRDLINAADVRVDRLTEEVRGEPLRVPAQAETIWDTHKPTGRPWPHVAGLDRRRGEIAALVADWHARMLAGQPLDIAEVVAAVDELYADLLDHRQRFAQLGLMTCRRDNYLPGHAVCVAVLAMATAGQLRWSQRDVKRAGVLGLLYDCGMLLVPERIRTGGCELSELDRNRVNRHPAYSVALLDGVRGLDPMLKLAAMQHHEREIGLGYPLGIRGDRICDHAKVLGIVDVFAAGASPRAYAQAKLPYTVMEELIRSAAAGTFCRVSVRALVAAAGLFPVGSHVLLSNDRVACILAANPNQLDRPVIQLLGDDGHASVEQPIDLSTVAADRLAVVKAVPGPTPARAAA